MFESLRKICKNVQKLDSDKLLKKVFNDPAVKEFVATLQQNQMYDDGVDSKGTSLGNYSEASVKIYGKPEGHIRMYDTGAFFKSIKIKSESQGVVISANTIKTSWDGAIDLLDRWANLLGLNEKSLSRLREYILPLFIEEVKQQIFL